MSNMQGCIPNYRSIPKGLPTLFNFRLSPCFVLLLPHLFFFFVLR